MSDATRHLHDALDAHARRSGLAYLHPDEPTVQLDLFGSARAVAWQEGKAAFLFASDGAWSELPHLYARYGTTATAALIAQLKALEAAGAVLVCDSGMQATALVFDVLMTPGAHAVLMRQVYNKTQTYLTWLADRVGGVGHDRRRWRPAALAAAIRPETRFVFAETFTNPLVRAQDLDALARHRRRGARRRRRTCGWSSTRPSPRRGRFTAPLLDQGVDVVLASGTKALGGTDRDLWGYVATSDITARQRRDGPDGDARRHPRLAPRRRRSSPGSTTPSARTPAARPPRPGSPAFLASHPRGQRGVPSVAADASRRRGDRGAVRPPRIAAVVPRRGADEARTRHVADVLATTIVVRYALSFDGLATKVNHHQTVSEYFTPRPRSAAQRLRPADPAGGRRRGRRRSDRRAQLDAAPRRRGDHRRPRGVAAGAHRRVLGLNRPRSPRRTNHEDHEAGFSKDPIRVLRGCLRALRRLFDMRYFWLNFHLEYACRNSGVCCSSGWQIPIERGVEGTLPVRDRRSLRLSRQPLVRDPRHEAAFLRALPVCLPDRSARRARHVVALLPDGRGAAVRTPRPDRNRRRPAADFLVSRFRKGLDARESLPPRASPTRLMSFQEFSDWETAEAGQADGARVGGLAAIWRRSCPATLRRSSSRRGRPTEDDGTDAVSEAGRRGRVRPQDRSRRASARMPAGTSMPAC